MATLHLPIDRNAGVPIYRQVYDGIRRAILEGRLRPGQRIPSTRGLATDLGVSRLPVLSAYEQLLHEGYLVGRTGSGTFVSRDLPDDLLRAPAVERLTPAARRTGSARQAPALDQPLPSSWSLPVVPFQVGLPALDLFPRSAWAKLVARHVRAETADRLTYGDPAGLRGLRSAVAEHLRAARAVRCHADQVLIVPGSQAALRFGAAALLEPHDCVAIEEPGYFGAHRAFRSAGATLVPVPVDAEGLSVTALSRRGGDIRLVYVTPSHQYPLGVTMSAARRFALLEWAERHQAWILEDDYDSEFRYVSRPVGALQGMDAHERVIYIGTFSKALFPAVRVGYVVVPPALWTGFLAARSAFDMFAPTLYQRALAELLQQGHFARHLRRMRSAYLDRRNALLRGVARHCGAGLRVHNSDAGLHVTALLRETVDDTDVVARLGLRGIAALPLSTSYLGPTRKPGLLLGFACATPHRLLHATRVLGEVLGESV
ncbi:MAG TPA: PLP-dependent aminotransferase family protein [Gemmatimonadaceae bacterium]|jgi:GntR family transcriptional regulator/MocR family aminotransferase|nr:PLP-dependent aminotransferase family protein [Gemmatimonadaceae bacterium]